MDLWVGSPIVSATFTNIQPTNSNGNLPPKPPKLWYTRERSIAIDRTVNVGGSSSSVGRSKENFQVFKIFKKKIKIIFSHIIIFIIQVCSSVKMLENFAVNFEAVAKVTAPNMRDDQVKLLLLRTGRNILETDEEEDSVLCKIFGTLSGNFIIGTSSVLSPVDEGGVCNSVLLKSKHNHKHTFFHTK